MSKKLHLILFFISASLLSGYSQDIHFSQYNETPQFLNPASTGVYSGYIRAIVNYKNQWMAMGKAYSTGAASIDAPLFDKKETKPYLGAGINFFSDKAGESKFGLTQANVCLSVVVPMTRMSKISVGFSGGGAQHKANLEGLQWGNQYNGKGFDTNNPSFEEHPINSFTYFDLGAGIYYEYFSGKATMTRNEQKRFAIGFACFHMNQPKQKYFMIEEKLYPKFVVSMNSHFDITGTRFSLLPSFACFIQKKSHEYNVGIVARYRVRNGTKITGFYSESGIALGVNYRINDAFIPQVYYEIADFAIGISYDYTTSKYASTAKFVGSIEVSLKYHIMKGAVMKNKDVI